MSARRPLLTATAAGTLLCALWFVPSANATAEKEAKDQAQEQARAQTQAQPPANSAQPSESPEPLPQDLRLADTGSGVDTTPYLIGGTAFLGVGAGFVAFSVRRAARLI
ncbi:hypothetical protein [Streptomyces spiramyceticus]|uniref:hypothetical protein n=1 Tax=Streptomyces spiramyceticus TaxID=299717 RepID=UPI00237A211F|nr:hypothetical protein [Streptomyces spiramyceticus]